MGTTYWAGEGKTELPAVFQAFLQCAERRIRCCGLLARTRKAGCGRQQISKSARGTRDKLPLMPSRRKGTTKVRTFLLWRPLPCVGYGTNRSTLKATIRKKKGKSRQANEGEKYLDYAQFLSNCVEKPLLVFFSQPVSIRPSNFGRCNWRSSGLKSKRCAV